MWTAIVAVGVAVLLTTGVAGYAVGRASLGTNQPAGLVNSPGQNQRQNPGFGPGQGPGNQGFGTQP
jgi:dUTPase